MHMPLQPRLQEPPVCIRLSEARLLFGPVRRPFFDPGSLNVETTRTRAFDAHVEAFNKIDWRPLQIAAVFSDLLGRLVAIDLLFVLQG